ncbi:MULTISPECIES: DUF6332 family protein [unclassified Streptomyces]|uniref:DUF6332 family protein n=1 Tax=unclassified Streptomyces TaxID=2593676 RepID=UPI0033A8B911
MGRRTKAEEDAETVEIVYALFAAAILAGAAFFGVSEVLPMLFGSLRARHDLLGPLAALSAVIVFPTVLVIVLGRFRRAAQPSQPGRTRPDS